MASPLKTHKNTKYFNVIKKQSNINKKYSIFLFKLPFFKQKNFLELYYYIGSFNFLKLEVFGVKLSVLRGKIN
jgi:hypothetical protein